MTDPPAPPSLLVVEDDRELAELIVDRLRTAGYAVRHAADGLAAIDAILGSPPDVVVLDLMLPGADGFEVLRRVRPAYRGGVLVLTARDDDLDQVEGLELGADDYVVKPVRSRVLVARVEALMRRVLAARAEPDGVCIAGALRMDRGRREATFRGGALDLTTTEFDLLAYLAERAGTVVDREHLYRDLNGTRYDGIDRSIDVHVSRLRHKLGDDPRSPQLIKTVRGVGYLLARDTP
jgi:two-component system response regulator RstA